MGFDDVARRMRGKDVDTASLPRTPELDEFVEQHRVAERSHGWKVLVTGAFALGAGAVIIAVRAIDPAFERVSPVYSPRAVLFVVVGVGMMIVGAYMVRAHRRRQLPRAKAVVRKRGRDG
jgi:hypothetical protein